MAREHSTGNRLENNPYAQLTGSGIINAEGQLVRTHVSHDTRPAIIRFLEKIQVSKIFAHNGSPCWEWIGCRGKGGYGQFKPDGRRGAKKSSPHRFSHEYFIGPIPEGFEADHLCKVRHCCNPLHLEAVTVQTNRERREYTHCRHGHELSEDNVYLNPQGKRTCRECLRRRQREFQAANPDYAKRRQFPCRQKD